MTSLDNEPRGKALIFAGPHGAGKDTLENTFRAAHPNTLRIVRHITRPMVPGEIDGQDYHFIDANNFREMAGQEAFIEYSTYPDCMAGTSYRELADKLALAEYASMAANFEEGIALHRKLGALGMSSVCLFISPVAREVMVNDRDAYIAALRARMLQRGRPDDRIDNKLAKASLYRDMHLASPHEAVYIDNSDGHLAEASEDISRLAVSSTVQN